MLYKITLSLCTTADIRRLNSFAEVINKPCKELGKNRIKDADGILICWETPKLTEGILSVAGKLKIWENISH
ncbi:hypothetical protein J7K43_05215 [Candidatus Calescamantes bacterium]|nr:hypothetical protein [Candidatus Calescamantes bacterium]